MQAQPQQFINDPNIAHPLPYARAMAFGEFSTVLIDLVLYLDTIYRGRNEYLYYVDHMYVVSFLNNNVTFVISITKVK